MKQIVIKAQAQILTPDEFFRHVRAVGHTRAYRLYHVKVTAPDLIEQAERALEGTAEPTTYMIDKDPSGRTIIKFQCYPVEYSATYEHFTSTDEKLKFDLSNAQESVFMILPDVLRR